METQVLEVRCVQYQFEIRIAADRAVIWSLLTDRVNEWWLSDFRMLGADSLVTLQPRAGGLLFEQAGDRSLLWYTILMVLPGESLDLAGCVTADFGGPATTLLSLKLRDAGGHTVLSIRDSLFGHVPDGQVNSLKAGWLQLFSQGLQAFAEQISV
jgi:hypothetical protein